MKRKNNYILYILMYFIKILFNEIKMKNSLFSYGQVGSSSYASL